MNQLVTAYLNRLGLDAETPSLQALTRIHRAHVERIPYETFWIHLKEGWGIDPLESFRRAATTRRGGYCFQLNGGLYTLLTQLGYRVSLNPANVHGVEGLNGLSWRIMSPLSLRGCRVKATLMADGGLISVSATRCMNKCLL